MGYDGFIIKPVADEPDVKENLVKTIGYVQWRAHRLTGFAVDLDTDEQLPMVCIQLGTSHRGSDESPICPFTENYLFHVHKVLTGLADRRLTHRNNDECLDYFSIPVDKLRKLSVDCTNVLLDLFPGRTLKEISDHVFDGSLGEWTKITDKANETLILLGLMDGPREFITTSHLYTLIDFAETLRDGLDKVTETNYVFYQGSW